MTRLYQSTTKRKRGRPKKVEDVEPEIDVREEVRETAKKVGRPRKVLSTPDKTIESDEYPDESPKATPKIRKHRDLPDKTVWGRVVGSASHDIIPCQRLPTNRVIMQRYRSMQVGGPRGTTMNDYANRLYDEILPIWKRAHIPTVEKKTFISRLVKLLSSWREKC